MTSGGWRIIKIDSGAYLGYRTGNLIVRQEVEKEIPLQQVRSILIQSQECVVSTKLLSEVMDRNISLVFCDAQHQPAGECVPYHSHTAASGNLMKQIAWQPEKKDLLWQQIVLQKLWMQECVAESRGKKLHELFFEYRNCVLPGDPKNVEGQGAKVYFHQLFGYAFSRRDACMVNAALNYGYAILLSATMHALTALGYRGELGIHHHSVVNPFNLACDLMEPFRPVVDALVIQMDFDNRETLDARDKKRLINLSYEPVLFGGQKYGLGDAVELFAGDCVSFLNEEKSCIREVDYVC